MLTTSSLNGEWNITEVNGTTLTTDPLPFIGFDVTQHRIYGNSGCNRMMGSFEADSLNPGKISFGQIGSTRMMCQDMKTEQAVLDALGKVQSYETLSDTKEEIALCSQNGDKLLILEKKVIKPLSLSELSGEWKIETINGNPLEANAEVSPFIGFKTDESRIYGNVGCNTINGELIQNPDVVNSLSFKNLAVTQMLCPEMETERVVLECLNATSSFNKMKNGNIVLLNNKGEELLVLKKQ